MTSFNIVGVWFFGFGMGSLCGVAASRAWGPAPTFSYGAFAIVAAFGVLMMGMQ